MSENQTQPTDSIRGLGSAPAWSGPAPLPGPALKGLRIVLLCVRCIVVTSFDMYYREASLDNATRIRTSNNELFAYLIWT